MSWFWRRIQFRHCAEVVHRAIDAGADEALLLEISEQLAELTLATAYHWPEQFDPGAFGPGQDGVGDLSGARARDRSTVVGTMGHAGTGPEEPHVVVDLGDGADCRAGIVAGALLLDRYRRGEPLDRIDVGLFHQAEELPSICRQ